MSLSELRRKPDSRAQPDRRYVQSHQTADA